jgi:hypothetical protein
MLRNVRVQFFQGLVKVIPDVYRKFLSYSQQLTLHAQVIERCKHTLLLLLSFLLLSVDKRNVRVQFFQGLVKVIPDVYRKFNSSDLISRMVSRVEALQNIYFSFTT